MNEYRYATSENGNENLREQSLAKELQLDITIPF
jgi:hypothetical protein